MPDLAALGRSRVPLAPHALVEFVNGVYRKTSLRQNGADVYAKDVQPGWWLRMTRSGIWMVSPNDDYEKNTDRGHPPTTAPTAPAHTHTHIMSHSHTRAHTHSPTHTHDTGDIYGPGVRQL